MKNTGFSRPSSAPIKLTKSIMCDQIGFGAFPAPAFEATWESVIQSCCAFQTSTGIESSRLIPSATYGPGRHRCFRAGGHKAKNTAQQSHCSSSVYLLRNPSPIHNPTQHQSRVVPLPWQERHPATIAAVQNKTESGSTVISTAPAHIKGVAVIMSTSANPVLPYTSRAKNRNNIKLRIAAMTGEKKRTPKAVSPQRLVPRNWV